MKIPSRTIAERTFYGKKMYEHAVSEEDLGGTWQSHEVNAIQA